MPAQVSLTDKLCLQALMENTADSIYFKDRRCRLLRASRKMAVDLGFSDREEIYGKTDIELFGEEFGKRTIIDDTRIMESGEPIIGLVESRRLEDGRANWTLTSKMPIHDKDGVIIGLMGITREINELKQNEINLQYLATHDSLTDLPKRYLMNDRLEHILANAKRSKLAFAIFYIDLNSFKTINDSYGHEVGDLLLRQVAQRLKKCVRAADTVARLGGDEFVVILAALHKSQDVSIVANKVQDCFSKSFSIKRHRIEIKASIGISLYPEHGQDQETLIKAADYAMYLSKKRAESFVVCPQDKFKLGEGTQPE
jgi:diguanylate cyclase (GGDEF)-like protein/PAS domain S-box-containing protein